MVIIYLRCEKRTAFRRRLFQESQTAAQGKKQNSCHNVYFLTAAFLMSKIAYFQHQFNTETPKFIQNT